MNGPRDTVGQIAHVKDVIADSLENECNPSAGAAFEEAADAILTALAEAGYRIVRDEPVAWHDPTTGWVYGSSFVAKMNGPRLVPLFAPLKETTT